MSGTASARVRLDSWIWAVRIYKTRSLAASECRAGHVRVNGDKVKPAHVLALGDEIRARTGEIERIIVVTRLVSKRVGATVASECYDDRTPAPEPREEVQAPVTRERGAGRPTKRERRDLERLRGR